MSDGIVADASGTDAAGEQLDKLKRKVATIATDVHELFPAFTGDDELTRVAVQKLTELNRSIAQILTGLALALRVDAQRTAATAAAYRDTAQKNQDTVSQVLRPLGAARPH